MLDVIAVNLDTKKVRIFATDKSERNAESIIDMAVLRRGVETEFYTTAEAGKYHDGDTLDDTE